LVIGFCACRIQYFTSSIAGTLFQKKSAAACFLKMVENVKPSLLLNLDSRVDEGNGKDEMAELAITLLTKCSTGLKNHLMRKDSLRRANISQTKLYGQQLLSLATIITELELSETKDRARRI
jgi:hypothetical protein